MAVLVYVPLSVVVLIVHAGKKSLYVRLGCRGDWPNIMPPGWNPLSGKEEATSTAYY
jgi:hypothetical protein